MQRTVKIPETEALGADQGCLQPHHSGDRLLPGKGLEFVMPQCQKYCIFTIQFEKDGMCVWEDFEASCYFIGLFIVNQMNEGVWG